jgi:hypothetical protein
VIIKLFRDVVGGHNLSPIESTRGACGGKLHFRVSCWGQ